MTTIDPNIEPFDGLAPAQADESVRTGAAALIDRTRGRRRERWPRLIGSSSTP